MENNTPKSFFRNPQNIIALAVSLISICAIVVSIKQTQIMSEQRALMHKQAKASVWPRLNVGISKSHSLEDYSIDMFAVIIGNAGVGPAIITDARVTFDGRQAENIWAAGEIMAGNILGEGYLAGFGMTIGTVFGRIAGQQAGQYVSS